MLHYLIVTCVLAATALAAPQAELEVDYARSHVVAKLKKGGLLRFLGHEHAVIPGSWSAAVVFDEQNLEASRISVDVAAPDLVIDSVQARELAGIDPDGPNDDDRVEIRAKMLSDEQLDAQRFPRVRFESTRIRLQDGGRLRLDGTLSLHGVSRDVEVDADFELTADGYVVRGDFEIKLRDFDIEPISIGGVVKVGNEVKISFEIYTVRKKRARRRSVRSAGPPVELTCRTNHTVATAC